MDATQTLTTLFLSGQSANIAGDLLGAKKLNDEHHVARRAYVGSNAKLRPIESLSSWRVLKHASLEFEKCGSGFPEGDAHSSTFHFDKA